MTSREEMINFARKALGPGRSATIKLTALSGRGSDRAFYRLTWGKTNSVVLIHYDPKRIENAFYADIAIFLREIGVNVPILICHDAEQCLMLMEDLGDNDLWSLRNEPWEIRQVFYKNTLAMVHKFHSFPTDEFPTTKLRLMDPFGAELYKWERDYFRNNFVSGICNIELEPGFTQQLEAELRALAEHIHATSRSLVHRDLQSQNIMLRVKEPYLIDFQGMRFGNPFYDLGSLLCDPYMAFSEEERLELLAYYHRLSESDLEWPDFQQAFWEASVQRLMQALGAYGFLGLKKGLTAFLDHIPAGLANLQRATSHVPILPRLRELLDKCQKLIGSR